MDIATALGQSLAQFFSQWIQPIADSRPGGRHCGRRIGHHQKVLAAPVDINGHAVGARDQV